MKKWLLAWAIVAIAVSLRHELFRDEVRALDIAAASQSLADLVHNLRNDGHPLLWYLVLYAGTHATGSLLVLKPIAFVVAAAAMWIWLAKAPFSRWHKVLFLFGTLPLYEYVVMCRNYGIAMMLMFAMAASRKRPAACAVLLALLANTNASAFILTGALAMILARELRGWLAVVAVGLAASAAMMYPDSTSVATGMHHMGLADVARSFAHALIAPSGCFARELGYGELVVRVVFVLFLVHLARKPWLALWFYLAGVGITMLDDLVYPMSYRHTGLLFIFALVLIWLDRDGVGREARMPPVLARVQAKLAGRGDLLLGAVLGLQILAGLPDVIGDFVGARSNVPALASYLREHAPTAIVIPEPDPYIEALPYYADNPIYLPREHRYFTVKIDFTTANQADLSLDELMDAADEASHLAPVVLALSIDLSATGTTTLDYGYGRHFTFTSSSLTRFHAHATELARFDDAANENFVLYAWH